MKLTVKQSRFCEEYLVSFNATQAAIKAGYSKASAAEIGSENLRKPNIRQKIDIKLKEYALSADETLKSISDIAKSSLNDYFSIREEYRSPTIMVPLKEVIKKIEEDIEDGQKFADRAELVGDELQEHLVDIARKKKQILKHQIELERNPKAAMLVPGKPELVEIAELDMPRLVQDKASGRIKAIKPTEYGLNVELYAADAALRDMARYHGLFEKDNEQLKTSTAPLTDDQFNKLLQTAREAKTNTGQ